MDVPLSQEIESEIRRLAAAAGLDAGQYAADLLAGYVEKEAEFRLAVTQATVEADRGLLVEEEDMDARVAAWFAS